MKNKGFTLVEVLAVIVVLAAIFLVSFPLFLNSAKKDKESKYSSMVDLLCTAGKSYIYASMGDYQELNSVGSIIQIPVQELIIYGSVSKDTKNELTGNTINDDTLKYTVLSDFSLSCEYIDN